MQKDLKIGLAVGLGLVAGAVAWVATRPSMSPEARMREHQQTAPAAQTSPVKEPNEQRAVSVIPRSPEPNLPPPQPQPLPVVAAAPPVETPPQEAAAAAQKPAEPVFDSTVYEQTEKIETQKFYIVRRGDTLSKISAKYYGSAGQWRKILEANKQTLTNPDKLTPGQKLIIP
jgi:nucleoid-associated protein YgaU